MIYRYEKGSEGDTSLRELKSRYIIVKNSSGDTAVGTVTQVYRVVMEEGEKVLKTVWEAISSCFGGGSWRNDAPWDNMDPWRNVN